MVFGGERAPLSERARRPTVVLTSRCTAAVKLSHMVAPTTRAAKKEHLPSSWLAGKRRSADRGSSVRRDNHQELLISAFQKANESPLQGSYLPLVLLALTGAHTGRRWPSTAAAIKHVVDGVVLFPFLQRSLITDGFIEGGGRCVVPLEIFGDRPPPPTEQAGTREVLWCASGHPPREKAPSLRPP